MTESNTKKVLTWLQSAVGRVREFAYAGQPGPPQERPRIAVALGGGFARGIAHLGVLRVLKQLGLMGLPVARTRLTAYAVSLVRATGSPINPSCFSTRRTPRWAMPRANPPPSATAMRGRSCGGPGCPAYANSRTRPTAL